MYPGHPDFSPDDWFIGGMILFGVLLVAAVMFGDGLTTYYYGARQADGSRLNGHWLEYLQDERR